MFSVYTPEPSVVSHTTTTPPLPASLKLLIDIRFGSLIFIYRTHIFFNKWILIVTIDTIKIMPCVEGDRLSTRGKLYCQKPEAEGNGGSRGLTI